MLSRSLPCHESIPFVVAGQQPLQGNGLIHKVWFGDDHWAVVFPIEGQISSNHKSVSSTHGAGIRRIAVPYGRIAGDSLKSRWLEDGRLGF